MARSRKTKSTSTKSPLLDAIGAEATKNYGNNVMNKGTDVVTFSHIPTGIFQIDVATLGGIPETHTTLIAGWESSSKTTTCIKIIAQAQRKYPHLTPVYIDAETHYDEAWFKINGVDTENLKVIQNLEFAEAYADVLDEVISTGEVSVVVLDSIASLIPMDDAAKSAEDALKMAGRAVVVSRMYSSVIRARQKMIRGGKQPATVIYVNQYREKIGGFQSFGTPTTLPGGNSQKFLSYLTIQLNKAKVRVETDPITGAKTPIDNTHHFKLAKPKAGASMLEGDFILVRSNLHERLNQGQLDDYATVLKYAKSFKMIGGGGKAQTCIFYQGEKFANQVAIIQRWMEDEEIFITIKAIIVALVRIRTNKKMMPSDGYLMGRVTEEIIPWVEKVNELMEAQ